MRLTLAGCLLALAPALHAQQVWVVDDTASTGPDFTDLQVAIDTVAEGDVLLLKTGTYSGMQIVGKGLTVVAGPNQAPVVSTQTSAVKRARVTGLGASQSVRIQGLEFIEAGADPALHLVDSLGTIWVEKCKVTSLIEGPGLRVSNCASVALLRVTAIGGRAANFADSTYVALQAGLDVELDSSVHSYGGTYTGGREPSYVYPCDAGVAANGSPGLPGVWSRSSQSFVFLSGRSCTGGQGITARSATMRATA